MQLTDFSVLTFDCYGTLIDWESGIITALQPLMTRAGQALTREAVLDDVRPARNATRTRPPGHACTANCSLGCIDELASAWGVMPDAAESQRFGASVGDWPAFADTVAALRYLKQHYKLVILSNIDRDSFRGTSPRLGVAFDAVYTARILAPINPIHGTSCIWWSIWRRWGSTSRPFCTPRKVCSTIMRQRTTWGWLPRGSTGGMSVRLGRYRGAPRTCITTSASPVWPR